MSKLVIEAGKFYRTRDGRKAQVIYTERDGPCPVIYLIDNSKIYSCNSEGLYYSGEMTDRDLVSEWTEPFERECWVNVYPSGEYFPYNTEGLANCGREVDGRTIRCRLTEITNEEGE